MYLSPTFIIYSILFFIELSRVLSSFNDNFFIIIPPLNSIQKI
nr:MAG TPA: hypothetical protein [Caudoviricetes sp.]